MSHTYSLPNPGARGLLHGTGAGVSFFTSARGIYVPFRSEITIPLAQFDTWLARRVTPRGGGGLPTASAGFFDGFSSTSGNANVRVSETEALKVAVYFSQLASSTSSILKHDSLPQVARCKEPHLGETILMPLSFANAKPYRDDDTIARGKLSNLQHE